MQAQAVPNYTYDSAYEEGYNAALEAMKKVRQKRQYITEYNAEAAAKEKHERAEYFFKQKLTGAFLIAASAIGLVATAGEFGIAFLTIPAGLFILFTKHRIFC